MDQDRVELNLRMEKLQLLLLRYFSIAISCICVFYCILFIKLGLVLVPIVSGVSAFFTLVLYFTFHRRNLEYLRAFELGIFLLTLQVFIYVIAFWENIPIVFLWFVLLPFALTIIKPFKEILYWSIGTVPLILSAPIITSLLDKHFDIQFANNFSPFNHMIINISTFFFIMCLVMMILYFYAELNKLKNAQLRFIHTKAKNTFIINDLAGGLIEQADIERNIIEESKRKELSENIQKHINTSHCYRDSSYNVQKLAQELDTNINYISKALNNHEGQSFKSLLNSYRIKEVKEKLDKKEYEKYTLQHIYKESGFEHQSTFNRVFKEIEGVTPSQYIESIKGKKS